MTASRRVHDLTALLHTGMTTWPGSPAPEFESVATVPRDGYAIERVRCFTHTGTHLDAPSHFLAEGATVDQIPPDRLVGSAILLDVRSELDGTRIPVEALQSHWPQGIHAEVALLRTGWSQERAPTRRYQFDFPGIDVAGAEWLVRQGLRGVGIDTLGIDPYANTKNEAHRILMKNGVWILEALDHLDTLVEGREYTLVAAPLKIAGASGAMARVFALEA
jgi:arylformamidase